MSRSSCGGPVLGEVVGVLCQVKLWGPCVQVKLWEPCARSSCGGPVPGQGRALDSRLQVPGFAPSAFA